MTGDYLLSLRIFLQYHLSSVVSSDKSPASLITFSLKLLYIFLFVFLDISLPLFFFFFFLRFHYGMSRCAFLMNYPDWEWMTPRPDYNIFQSFWKALSLSLWISPCYCLPELCLDVCQAFSLFLQCNIDHFYMSRRKYKQFCWVIFPVLSFISSI